MPRTFVVCSCQLPADFKQSALEEKGGDEHSLQEDLEKQQEEQE